MNRLTFGARPGDSAAVQKIGLRAWIDRELHPEKQPESVLLVGRLRPYETLRLTPGETVNRYSRVTPSSVEAAHVSSDSASKRQPIALLPVELQRERILSENPQRLLANDLAAGKILRAVYSEHSLEEVMIDFWFNHFNVFLNKGADRFLVPTYERESIRPHVFGKFYDLLLATAESPAMLFYLDNWQSVGQDAKPAVGRNPKRRGINENYGRELLELHTLGVDGGYTQADVIAVARCFTGWTISGPRRGGGFEYNDRLHDKGEKVVLGHIIQAGGGMNDGLEVLRILAHHPSTAHFISLKLARHFVAENPPTPLVDRMARTFLKSDEDIREVLKSMLSSREFWSQGAYHARIKSPFEFLVSALRASGADVASTIALSNELQKLGEPLYRKIEPTGYPDSNQAWVSSSGLLGRMNFSVALARNRIPGVRTNLPENQVISVIGSPEFQKR